MSSMDKRRASQVRQRSFLFHFFTFYIFFPHPDEKAAHVRLELGRLVQGVRCTGTDAELHKPVYVFWGERVTFLIVERRLFWVCHALEV